MKRKLLVVLLALMATICLAFGLSACTESESHEIEQNTPSGNESDIPGGNEGNDGNEGNTPGGNEGEQGGEQFAEGLEYNLSYDGTYYIVTGIGTVTDTEIIIPSTYNGLPVTSIGNSAFDGCTSLTGIEIPDSVTSINMWAFRGCTSLTSMTIPESVIDIGYGAFSGCFKLVEVYNLSGMDITAGSTNNGYVAYYAKAV